MGKKEKLIERLKTQPKDFSFDEAETLLKYMSYRKSNKGKTSGSTLPRKSSGLPTLRRL